jgi:hypothetical protein
MGLDIYIFKSPSDLACEPFVEEPDKNVVHWEELIYWRKHYWLNDWIIENHRRKKNLGQDIDFNNKTFKIDVDDLDKLETDVIHHVGEYDNGFGTPRNELMPHYLGCISTMRHEIKGGNYVYYNADW